MKKKKKKPSWIKTLLFVLLFVGTDGFGASGFFYGYQSKVISAALKKSRMGFLRDS